MSRARYYRRDGTPIEDVLTWARLFENIAYKRVAETFLDDGTRISTIWIGLDHSFVEIYGDDRPPLIFESMVFSPETKKSELVLSGEVHEFHEDWDCERYSTEAEAIMGHDRLVRKWKEIREQFKTLSPREGSPGQEKPNHN